MNRLLSEHTEAQPNEMQLIKVWRRSSFHIFEEAVKLAGKQEQRAPGEDGLGVMGSGHGALEMEDE